MTDYCWREGSSKETRQSRSNRRKTILFFTEPAEELVGFAAWRMREEQISGTMQVVGEVRFLAVIPDYRGRGVASQMWSTVKTAIVTSDHGSAGTIIRIEVDHANAKAREVYERGWGFEYSYSHVSGGKPYDVLLYRPQGESGTLDESTDESAAVPRASSLRPR
ncbi:MAG: GNAT family N-acetyltransferase [Solirubrobacteraceae bacterium]